MKQLLQSLLHHESLSYEQSNALLNTLVSDDVTDAQIAAALIALKSKGESLAEMHGFVDALCANALHIPYQSEIPVLFDNCGTGGDGFHTFNLSTTVSFVLAAAGLPVAKHGNRSVSSQCGSADVLEALGVCLTPPPSKLATLLEELNFAFLLAPHVHPRLARVGAVRRQLGVPTIFNVVGPLANPMQITHQLVGVFSEHLAEEMVQVLRQIGRKRAVVVRGYNGLDEVSLEGPNDLWVLDKGEITKKVLDAAHYGFTPTPLTEIRGGAKEENARLLRCVLKGERSAYYDYTVFNSAVCLYTSEVAESIEKGIEMSMKAIDSGAALRVLEKYITLSNEVEEGEVAR
ncbi:MAG: anthranilate phosphoribosyltransferase [Bacilli bacterium]